MPSLFQRFSPGSSITLAPEKKKHHFQIPIQPEWRTRMKPAIPNVDYSQTLQFRFAYFVVICMLLTCTSMTLQSDLIHSHHLPSSSNSILRLPTELLREHNRVLQHRLSVFMFFWFQRVWLPQKNVSRRRNLEWKKLRLSR